MTRQLAPVVAVMGIVTAWAYGQIAAKKDAPPNSPAPKTDKPLLLKDGPDAKPPEGMAHNSRCHVCHLNYAQNPWRSPTPGPGLAKCHGPSDAHIDDESWTSGGKGTPPDKMYLPNKVNALCMNCHKVKKTESHQVLFADVPQKKICTDCHGKHRLTKGKCKWKYPLVGQVGNLPHRQ